MPSTPAETSDEDRRERYERVLRIVAYQTGGPQRPLTPDRVVRMLACRAGYDPDDVRSSLQAAVENGDLLRTAREGRTLYARTDDESLQAVVLAEVERDDVDQDLIGRCYTLMGGP